MAMGVLQALLPSPLSEFGGPSFSMLGTKLSSQSDLMDVWGLELNYDVMVRPYAIPFGELHADDKDLLESSPLPYSLSQQPFL
ncbi:hypothetical protein V8E53_001343, partial [Lactarius tabidus]